MVMSKTKSELAPDARLRGNHLHQLYCTHGNGLNDHGQGCMPTMPGHSREIFSLLWLMPGPSDSRSK